MTTLAGLHVPGEGTWFGSDIQITADNMKMLDAGKWIRRGSWAVGLAGDYRTLCLMRQEAQGLLDGVRSASEIVSRLERLMASNNYSAATDGPFGPPSWGQSFLIAGATGLWSADISLALYSVPPGVLWAAGTGCDYALGAGHATRQLPPAQRVRTALETAITFDIVSGGEPFTDAILLEASPPEKSSRRPKKAL